MKEKTAALKFARSNHSRFVEQLGEWASFPSISTEPSHIADLRHAAVWLANYLTQLEFDNIRFFPPDSHPILFAENLKAGPEAPTVLIYGHYDVQPSAPLDKWESDPFHPVVRGENFFARGATDMKGQVLAVVYALESILQSGELPVNVKFLVEGEEEIGSPHLGEFITKNNEIIASDFCLNPDTGILDPDLPTITYALRGLAYYELRVFGPKNDLHSGTFGGVIHNPAQALCELIAGMHNKDGQITLPGFYDQVRPLEEEEREELRRLPQTEAFYIQRTGVSKLWGEPDFTPVERVGARPTLEVNGLYSGFTGEGSKTVLPTYAMAKISMRLIPDQDPQKVKQQLIAYLEKSAPETIRWELIELVQAPAALSNRNSRWIQTMEEALETTWGTRPVFRREGGSVPVVAQLQDILDMECVNIGFGLPDDNMHGPNEKLHLPTWKKGIEALIHFFYNLAE